MSRKDSAIPSYAGSFVLILLGIAVVVAGVVIFTLVRDAEAYLPYGLYASVLAVVLGLLIAGFGVKNVRG